METRVLKYFLMVAKTGNITRAANELHVTQPTLSRQIMELEKELQTKLFIRQPRHMELTKGGALFQQRAQMILTLLQQTTNDLQQQNTELTGTIHLGCVESSVSPFIGKLIKQFQQQYPAVKFAMFDGDGDTLREQLDRGLIDMAALIEPVEAAKYNYVVLPVKETWGVMMRSDDALAARQQINRADIYKLPLILTRRNILRNDVSDVLGLDQNKLDVRMTINLPMNSLQMIKQGGYYALNIMGVYQNLNDHNLAFVPVTPTKTTGHVLAWRKNLVMSPAAEQFLQLVAAATTDQQ
ncbi:LysR family transcriptional regulator [Limosilactobacillus difficilis]|uniref:LysR family transcriptional regulator n=1 Tax=Limosilactobacillus difficilis TaxID=2991838 RepID=UPI0024BB21A4|nr:LysR family transcriptional regulator [Limosilactobacillus difficilis]